MDTGLNKTRLAEFYEEELGALRGEASVFSDQHPEMARALGIHSARAADPQVDLLLQSFAFLSGRVRHQVEVDKARVPNALAEALHPHLSAPLPSMLVARMDQIAKGVLLERGQGLSAAGHDELGRQVDCRFRSSYRTAFLPLEVSGARMRNKVPGEPAHVRAVLSVDIGRQEVGRQAKLGRETLRFYINSEHVPAAFKLYELMALHLLEVRVGLPDTDGRPGAAPVATPLRWLGYAEDEAMLPFRPQTAPGYRLLQEYFAFPQKFMFFEIGPVDLAAMGENCRVEFFFGTPCDAGVDYGTAALYLNCVPLVNLYSQHIEPLALDHTEFEYRLLADLELHACKEIYSLDQLYSIRPDGSMRAIAPYFGLSAPDVGSAPDYYYVARRERSETSNVDGGEFYVSFLDSQFDMTRLMDEVVGGVALCTNRRLPEQLRLGTALQLEGAGPVYPITTFSKPTLHCMPDQIGRRPWALVSQLTLNHLSLNSSADGLLALKEILGLHVGTERQRGLRQIAGIKSLTSAQVMRLPRASRSQGFIRATRIHLQLDRADFPGASPVLFWCVLRHFFALYIQFNNLVENSFATQDSAGDDRDWDSLDGMQCVL